jgi:hypothetical protein
MVDEVCMATVTGFAVVSRLVGDPDYAGVPAWTAASVMRTGHAVLAARLDQCTGSFARDASAPGILVPPRRHDAALEAVARDALLGSSVSRQVQRAWDEQVRGAAASDAPGADGAATAPWYDRATVTSEVLDDLGRGTTYVSVHAYVEHGCGDPEGNVWGLFAVRPGGLAPVELRALGEIEIIDQLIDIDGDGELEILGRPWLGLDRMVARAGGRIVDRLALPLFGCPC